MPEPRRPAISEHELIHALEEPTVDRESAPFQAATEDGWWLPEYDLIGSNEDA